MGNGANQTKEECKRKAKYSTDMKRMCFGLFRADIKFISCLWYLPIFFSIVFCCTTTYVHGYIFIPLLATFDRVSLFALRVLLLTIMWFYLQLLLVSFFLAVVYLCGCLSFFGGFPFLLLLQLLLILLLLLLLVIALSSQLLAAGLFVALAVLDCLDIGGAITEMACW